jgi:hypothetical protein
VIEPAGEPAQRIVPEVEDPLSLAQKRLRTLGGGVSDFGARLLVLSLDRDLLAWSAYAFASYRYPANEIF